MAGLPAGHTACAEASHLGTANAGSTPGTLHIFSAPSAPPREEARSGVHIGVMAGGLDHLHPFGQQRAEAGAAFDHGVPGCGLFVPGPIEPAQIVRHRKLRGSGQIGQAERGAGQPLAVIDQVIDVIEVLVCQLHRLAQHAAIGGLAIDQPFLHPLVQQRRGDIAEEVFVEQRGQAANFGAGGGGTVDQRVLVHRLFEVFADRATIAQGNPALAFMHHRGAPGRIEREEIVARFPRVFAPQFIRHALFAELQADLAAERTQGELVKLPHAAALPRRDSRFKGGADQAGTNSGG